MNCTALNYPDACFNAVIDKGTLDCLLCGESSTANTGRYTHEVARVLKPGGVFIVVSFGPPENRLSCACCVCGRRQRAPRHALTAPLSLPRPADLEGDYGWFVTVQTIAKPSINTAGLPEASGEAQAVHYVYICKKP